MRFSTSISVLALATTVLGLSGEATFYGGNLAGGACSFSTYTLPSGIYGTALSDSNWDNAGNCGACISVTGPNGNSITAMIVDECPGCGLNHLDLFPDAFKELANPSKGVIPTTWEYVDCPITSPLQVHNKDGASQWWFSMQVVNANKAIAKLEVSIDEGNTWHGTDRQSYNFFQNSAGFGTESVMVKVTSVDEDLVIVSDVKVASGVVAMGPNNFISESGQDSNPPTSTSQSMIQLIPIETPTSSTDTAADAAAKAEATPQPGAMTLQSSSSAAIQAVPASTAPPAAKAEASPQRGAELLQSSSTITPIAPASSAAPAADVFASPSAVAMSVSTAAAAAAAAEVDDNTTTISSTTTVSSTVTVKLPSSVSPAPAKPTLSMPKYPTAPAVASSTIVYNCGSGTSAAGIASSTMVIAVSSTTTGPHVTVSILPYTGAASRRSGTSFGLAVFAVTVAAFMI